MTCIHILSSLLKVVWWSVVQKFTSFLYNILVYICLVFFYMLNLRCGWLCCATSLFKEPWNIFLLVPLFLFITKLSSITACSLSKIKCHLHYRQLMAIFVSLNLNYKYWHFKQFRYFIYLYMYQFVIYEEWIN